MLCIDKSTKQDYAQVLNDNVTRDEAEVNGKRLYKYQRPYCKLCKTIFPHKAYGYVFQCPQCGQPLSSKSFDPRPKIAGGIALIIAGVVIIFLPAIPFVWIGAFIWGVSLIATSTWQWHKIQGMDQFGPLVRNRGLK